MAKILRIVVRRAINAVITIFGIVCLNYILVRLMPGNAVISITPHDPKYQGLAAYYRALFGLDKPPYMQFLVY